MFTKNISTSVLTAVLLIYFTFLTDLHGGKTAVVYTRWLYFFTCNIYNSVHNNICLMILTADSNLPIYNFRRVSVMFGILYYLFEDGWNIDFEIHNILYYYRLYHWEIIIHQRNCKKRTRPIMTYDNNTNCIIIIKEIGFFTGAAIINVWKKIK